MKKWIYLKVIKLDINTSKDKLIFQISSGNIFVLDAKKFQLIFLVSNKNIYRECSIYFLDDLNFIAIESGFYFNIFNIMEYRSLNTYSKYYCGINELKSFKNEIFQKIGNDRFIIANYENMKLFEFKNNKVQEIGNLILEFIQFYF